jgi:hypothetical protein
MSSAEIEDEIERRLEQLAVTTEFEEVLREYASNGSNFKLKHVDDYPDFTRGDIFRLESHGLIEDAHSGFGRVVNWTLSDVGSALLDALESDDVSSLTPYQSTVLTRTPKLLDWEPDTEFTASDRGLSSSKLASLSRAGFIEEADASAGSANTWRVTERVDLELSVLEGI